MEFIFPNNETQIMKKIVKYKLKNLFVSFHQCASFKIYFANNFPLNKFL